MKKSILILAAAVVTSAFVTSCSSCKQKPAEGPTTDNPQNVDSLSASNDSTVWGHLGEETSMNVYQFISDAGDTLSLMRSSMEGEDGNILGDANVETDRFAVTIGNRKDPENMYVRTLINTSQIMGTWKSKDNQLTLSADGSAQSTTNHYTTWKIVNCKLVLSGKTTTEYGETERTDTMELTWLDTDTMKLLTPQHEEIALGR